MLFSCTKIHFLIWICCFYAKLIDRNTKQDSNITKQNALVYTTFDNYYELLQATPYKDLISSDLVKHTLQPTFKSNLLYDKIVDYSLKGVKNSNTDYIQRETLNFCKSLSSEEKCYTSNIGTKLSTTKLFPKQIQNQFLSEIIRICYELVKDNRSKQRNINKLPKLEKTTELTALVGDINNSDHTINLNKSYGLISSFITYINQTYTNTLGLYTEKKHEEQKCIEETAKLYAKTCKAISDILDTQIFNTYLIMITKRLPTFIKYVADNTDEGIVKYFSQWYFRQNFKINSESEALEFYDAVINDFNHNVQTVNLNELKDLIRSESEEINVMLIEQLIGIYYSQNHMMGEEMKTPKPTQIPEEGIHTHELEKPIQDTEIASLCDEKDLTSANIEKDLCEKFKKLVNDNKCLRKRTKDGTHVTDQKSTAPILFELTSEFCKNHKKKSGLFYKYICMLNKNSMKQINLAKTLIFGVDSSSRRLVSKILIKIFFDTADYHLNVLSANSLINECANVDAELIAGVFAVRYLDAIKRRTKLLDTVKDERAKQACLTYLSFDEYSILGLMHDPEYKSKQQSFINIQICVLRSQLIFLYNLYLMSLQ